MLFLEYYLKRKFIWFYDSKKNKRGGIPEIKNKTNMSLLEQKKDFSKRGVFDELYTPDEAVEMILPYIPKEVKT